MKKNNCLFTLYVFLFLGIACKNQQRDNKWTSASPDGSLKITMLKEADNLFYFVMIDGDTAIRKSALGINFSDESFDEGLEFVSVSENKIDDRYTMVTGKRKENHGIANETIISFKNKNNTPIQMVLRAYNEGVAFCYRFPEIKKTIIVNKESTTFAVPANGKAWIQSYGLPAQWAPSYEEMYSNGIPVGQAAPDTSGYSFAALFESNNHWLLLTEAGLDENFYGSHLQQNCDNGIYKIAAPQTGEGNGLYNTYATTDKPFSTPWRTIIVGKSLSTIIESNLVHHLSQPNKTGDISWIKPGRSSWSWWSDHPSSKNYNSLKKCIGLSKEMGWEYSLVDANWDIMKGGNIEQLIKYAKRQGVGLSLWYNSAGPHSAITERPRDIMSDPVKRKAEFKKLNAWGIKTVKVDFFNSDKQELIKQYIDILKDAAAEHIMVVTHGCTLPRGWARPYPNLLSMEAVHGAEQYNWDSTFAKQSPVQNIIYAYTRNVVGSMDYTPVTFSSYPCCPHATSNAYELALPVLFESGITHFADAAKNFQKTDSLTHLFLRSVPTTWDDTKFIQGYPGKELIIARQKGPDWYVAVANGEETEKNITLDFSFLPKGEYKMTVMKDGANNRTIVSEQISYTTGNSLQIKVLPHGGFTIMIKKINSIK
jgi:alpha-glucosidase